MHHDRLNDEAYRAGKLSVPRRDYLSLTALRDDGALVQIIIPLNSPPQICPSYPHSQPQDFPITPPPTLLQPSKISPIANSSLASGSNPASRTHETGYTAFQGLIICLRAQPRTTQAPYAKVLASR